jgi:hypothetical protein
MKGDCGEMRDRVIECGLIGPLETLIRRDTSNSVLCNIAWTLANLCRHKIPKLTMNVQFELLSALTKLLSSNDKDVLARTCLALFYLSDGPNEIIDVIIRNGNKIS